MCDGMPLLLFAPAPCSQAMHVRTHAKPFRSSNNGVADGLAGHRTPQETSSHLDRDGAALVGCAVGAAVGALPQEVLHLQVLQPAGHRGWHACVAQAGRRCSCLRRRQHLRLPKVLIDPAASTGENVNCTPASSCLGPISYLYALSQACSASMQGTH